MGVAAGGGEHMRKTPAHPLGLQFKNFLFIENNFFLKSWIHCLWNFITADTVEQSNPSRYLIDSNVQITSSKMLQKILWKSNSD